MTGNPATENQQEHDWIEDYQRHHHRGEVMNGGHAQLLGAAGIHLQSGITGHEHVEPEYEFEIPPPTEGARSSRSRSRSWPCSSRWAGHGQHGDVGRGGVMVRTVDVTGSLRGTPPGKGAVTWPTPR